MTLLSANQIAYIFLANDINIYINLFFQYINFLRKKKKVKLHDILFFKGCLIFKAHFLKPIWARCFSLASGP